MGTPKLDVKTIPQTQRSGDGTNGFGGPTNLHTYTANGVYTACLYIYDSLNFCMDTICSSVTVTGLSPCNASFSNSYVNNTLIQFTNSSTAPGAFTSTWYFGNANMVTQGAKAFELKWGNRPNVDNWSRLDAISTTALNKEDETKQKEDEEVAILEDQEEKQSVDKYLSAIPNTEEQMTTCQSSRENALYNASVILLYEARFS